ncbi:hypothetical protein C8R44DRAFT_723804 [Mycena epipterygia]|nr:hypothetical protein C8R44DRAFT_723804 [Mycena epipterygia]
MFDTSMDYHMVYDCQGDSSLLYDYAGTPVQYINCVLKTTNCPGIDEYLRIYLWERVPGSAEMGSTDWDHPTTEQINGTKHFLAPAGIRNLPESKLPLCPHAGNPHRTNTECRMTFHHHRHESGQISYLQVDEKYHHCPFIIILCQRESMKGEKDGKALSLASSHTSVPVKREDNTKLKVEHKIKPERTPSRNSPKPSLFLFTHAPLSSHPLTKLSRRSNAALTSPPFSSSRQIQIKSEPRVLDYLPSSSSRPMQIKTEITILDSPPSSPVPGSSNNSPPHPPNPQFQAIVQSLIESQIVISDAKGHFLYDEKSADFPPEFFRYRNVDNNPFANRIFDVSVFSATISGKLLQSLTRTHGAAATSWNNFPPIYSGWVQCPSNPLNQSFSLVLRKQPEAWRSSLYPNSLLPYQCARAPNLPPGLAPGQLSAAPFQEFAYTAQGLALLALNSRLGLPQLHWEAVKAAHEAHLDAGRCSDFAVTGGGVICAGHGTGKMLGANSKIFRESLHYSTFMKFYLSILEKLYLSGFWPEAYNLLEIFSMSFRIFFKVRGEMPNTHLISVKGTSVQFGFSPARCLFYTIHDSTTFSAEFVPLPDVEVDTNGELTLARYLMSAESPETADDLVHTQRFPGYWGEHKKGDQPGKMCIGSPPALPPVEPVDLPLPNPTPTLETWSASVQVDSLYPYLPPSAINVLNLHDALIFTTLGRGAGVPPDSLHGFLTFCHNCDRVFVTTVIDAHQTFCTLPARVLDPSSGSTAEDENQGEEEAERDRSAKKRASGLGMCFIQVFQARSNMFGQQCQLAALPPPRTSVIDHHIISGIIRALSFRFRLLFFHLTLVRHNTMNAMDYLSHLYGDNGSDDRTDTEGYEYHSRNTDLMQAHPTKCFVQQLDKDFVLVQLPSHELCSPLHLVPKDVEPFKADYPGISNEHKAGLDQVAFDPEVLMFVTLPVRPVQGIYKKRKLPGDGHGPAKERPRNYAVTIIASHTNMAQGGIAQPPLYYYKLRNWVTSLFLPVRGPERNL